MRHQKFLGLLLLLCTNVAVAQLRVPGYFSIRSQGRNSARKVAGTVGWDYLRDQDNWNWYTSKFGEYTRTFRPQHIARCLFGDKIDKCGEIEIQGKDVTDRDSHALLADYFYLPSDFSSVVKITPRISNIIADFHFYMGLDKCFPNWYFRMYSPLVRTRWDLNLCESIIDTGNQNHPEGYFTPRELSRDWLLSNFCEFLSGAAPCSLNDNIGGNLEDVDNPIGDEGNDPQVITIEFTPLKFARMCKSSMKETRLADLRAELGWNFFQREDSHLGFNFQFAAPTGNRPNAGYVFDAIVGNGGHWEFGGGLTGSYVFWRNDAQDAHIGAYLDASLTHMFATRQKRTFDLVNKPLSRYMLAMKFGAPVNVTGGPNQQASLTELEIEAGKPKAEFKGVYNPVANLTTMDVDVSVALQADIALWLNYTTGNLSFDVGYNFWGRSCEKVECVECDFDPCCVDLNICAPGQKCKWGLKGDASVFGFFAGDVTSGTLERANVGALSATQNDATACTGTNDGDVRNAGVDNAEFAHFIFDDGNTQPMAWTRSVADPTDITAEQTRTSVNPELLSCDDVDFCVSSRGLSHKLWTNLQYTYEHEVCTLMLAVGGEVEFGKDMGSPDCDEECDTGDCIDCAITQWGLWVKTGMTFDL